MVKGLTYFVYELRDQKGVPFYVGKGKGRRDIDHRYKARSGKNAFRVHRKIAKIWREGGDFTCVKVFHTNDEAKAHAEEVRLISFYGRKNLTNLTDGGEGCSGKVMSPETRAILSKAHTGKKMSEESRRRMSEFQRGRKHSPEETEKRRQKMLGYDFGEAFRLAIVARQTGRTQSAETREKLRLANLGKKLSLETVAKMRLRKSSPESTAKRVAANTGKKRTDELKQRMSLKMKGRTFSPETIQHMREGRLRYLNKQKLQTIE